MKKNKSLSPKKNKPSKRKERAERMEVILKTTGLKKKTIQNATWVASHVPPSSRNPNLSMKHHAAVASLHPDNQKAVLDAAEKNGWTAEYTGLVVRQMKSEIEGNDKWVLHEVEKIKRSLKKIADEYRDWELLKDVVKAIDEFVAREIEIKPAKTDEPSPEPPTETPEQK